MVEANAQNSRDKVGAVMVVGAGIGGMQAALDLANAGFHVTLVEETTAIGGRMAQLDKTFPTNDCSMCTISPKLIEVDKHLNIDVVTNADVIGLEGEAGNFRVKVRKRPRFVNLEKCNACGDCLEKCPVALPSEFDQGMMARKAIFKRYPQAIPAAVAISKAGRAPCRAACPAAVHSQGYVALIRQRRYKEAAALVRRDLPLPSVCGRVCYHPCEDQCERGKLDQPVAICALKRFVGDWALQHDSQPEPFPLTHQEKVAVVGSGPAGLACANELIRRGYPVTVFEAAQKAGGMLRYGIPAYRLPDRVLDQDLDYLRKLGIRIQTGKPAASIADLKSQGFQAVFVSTGAPRGAPLGIPGEESEGVLDAIRFLRGVNSGAMARIEGSVAVIGGGNSAIDAARAAVRLGASQVKVVYRRSRAEMPAHDWEIEEAEAEGVGFEFLAAPIRIERQNGGVKRLVCLRMTLGEPDQSGRPKPVPVEGSDFDILVNLVIPAIGQSADLGGLGEVVQTTPRGWISSDAITLATNVPGVFAGGDVVTGPASVVDAFAAGKRAAESIDRYLRGVDLREGRDLASPTAPGPGAEDVKPQPRATPKTLGPARRRASFDEIVSSLTEEQAVAEAQRCLNCGICSECLQCVIACTAGAILHDMLPEEITVEVGAVLLAPGYEPFDPLLRGEYGYGRYKNVVTSLEFERILSASGPYQGHVRRPSDLAEPKRVAWIQCVGSRDPQLGNDYCSSVCCMYAVKEAIMAVDHVPGLEATIFYNDIRAYGKGFEAYYEGAKKNYGVRFKRGIISSVKERQQTRNLALAYVSESGQVAEEEFDLVVLSVGLRPSASTAQLAKTVGVELDRFGFCRTDALAPSRTSKEGIYVAGTFAAPMDIPETVMAASGAAATAAEALHEARGTRVREKTFPPERDVAGEEPRVGVFVCRCGTNIARVVGVSDVVDYARSLPYVAHVEENLYTCSTDTQRKIVETIQQYNLNRVVVASCTPRTHEPLFQETLREAGLNRHLFEMANIRDQCSWVHFSHPREATFKAKDLVRMAVARAATLRPFPDIRLEVDQRAIVLGAGVAGMTAALGLADQGFEVALVEREPEPGGIARQIRHTLQGADVQAFLADLVARVKEHPQVRLYTGATLEDFSGHVGKFKAKLRHNSRLLEVGGGAVIVATGGAAYNPTEYAYGQSAAILTQLELEQKLADPHFARGLKQVAMIQCVGSREEGHPWCSRVCCQEAIKNALAIKRANPAAGVFVLFRDIRTYGFDEIEYERAREAGVVFIRFEPEKKPEVTVDGGLRVRVIDDVLDRPVELRPDLLVLSAGIRPHPEAEAVSQALKVPLNADGFFLEAHMKLRPLDFGSEGIFLAGLAHAPKTIAESISQAKGAAARAATVLSKPFLDRSGVISEVDSTKCAACLTCVRLCPYDVPVITEEGVAFIEPASCQGCGVCAAACPRKAIVTRHYRDEQIAAKVDVLFGDAAFEAAGAAALQSGGET